MDEIQKQLVNSTESARWMVLLIGPPGAGKTTGMLTFPDVIVVDYDRKLPSGVPTIPIWDEAFCDTLIKRQSPLHPVCRRDCIRKWLRQYGTQIPPGHTLGLDSWTKLQIEFDQYAEWDPSPYMTKGTRGEPPEYDGRKFYDHKLTYSNEICTLLAQLKCHVVVTCHEQINRDKEGNPTGLVKPLQRGQFADQMAIYFNLVARCVIIKGVDGKPQYKWRIASDADFYAIRPPSMPIPTTPFIEPTFKSISQYLTGK